MLATPSASGAMPVMESTLAKLLKPRSLSPAAAQSLDAQLAKIAEQFPRDISVRIVQTLVAMERDPGAAGEAVRSLDAFIAATPLEELKAGQRANSRQRAEAAQHIGLWLVARDCFRGGEVQDGDLQKIAQRLADRAVTAAQRQTEPAMLAAIVYEKGLLALQHGDRGSAERDWGELIDLAIVLPRQPRTSVTANSGASPPVGNAPRSAPSAASPSARQSPAPQPSAVATAKVLPRPAGPIPATLSQFSLATAIAKSAAEHGMTDLSLRAVREALSGGLPVPDLAPQTAGAAPMRVLSRPTPNARPDIDTTVISEVSSRMWQLSVAWRQTGFPPEQVCGLLESLVFARPGSIVLYEQPIGRDWQNPRSVGRLLVEWTIRAGRADELVKQIDGRKTTPGDELAGKVLLVQLDAALGHSNDAKRDEAKQHLAAIGSLLDSGRSAALAGTASHAVGAALADPLLAASTTPVLEKISEVDIEHAGQLLQRRIRWFAFSCAQALAGRTLRRQKSTSMSISRIGNRSTAGIAATTACISSGKTSPGPRASWHERAT